ncbi:unnamed protein product [Lymnaea stagnalis]|uniref:CARD domain-containing protein n=1 Tax=Lymnaea stagnalis TaxID=6523 RepID=A0AAV2H9X5_LYMST
MKRVEKKHMTDLLASKLRINLPFIEEQVEANDLLTYLFADSIIDVNDKETVSRAVNRKERASCLVTLLMSRGDRAYSCFLEALSKENYTHVVDRISGRSYTRGESSDGGAAAAHGDIVKISLDEKVSHLEDRAVIHDRRLERISRRLDDAVKKEDLKVIQQEIHNLNVAADKEREINSLKSQLRAKEAELASLTKRNYDQVKQLMDEIASLKQKAEKGEKELQQYLIEKAKLENRVQDLIQSEVSTKQEIETIKEEAKHSQEKLKHLEDSHQRDANVTKEQMRDLMTFKEQMLSLVSVQRSQQPSSEACSQPVARTPRAQLPLKEHFIQLPESKIKGPNSQRQQQPSSHAAEPKVSSAGKSSTKQ